MLAMIDQGGLEAHPAYWAPFIVVGEGSGAVQEAQTALEIGRTKAKTIAPRAAGASAKKASQARGPSARGKSNDGDWPSSFFAR